MRASKLLLRVYQALLPDDRPQAELGAAALMEQFQRRAALEALSGQPQPPVRVYGAPGRTAQPGSAWEHRSADHPGGEEEVAARLFACDQFLATTFQQAALGIGAPTPASGTLRGRVGRVCILLLRRLLWWYTRSLAGFAATVSRLFGDQITLLAAMARLQREQSGEIAALREELHQLRRSLAPRGPGDE